MTGDRPVIRELIEQAIADMTFARQTHLAWAEHLEAHSISNMPCAECAEKPYKLDATHEREWVAKYDNVLALLAAVSTGAQEPPTPDWITDRSLGIGLEIPPDGEYFLASHAPGPAPLAEICQRLVDALRGDECGHVLGSPHAAHCPVCRAVAELLVAISAGASAPGPARAETEQAVHMCAGCHHRWEGELKGAELCGDCWREAGAILSGEAIREIDVKLAEAAQKVIAQDADLSRDIHNRAVMVTLKWVLGLFDAERRSPQAMTDIDRAYVIASSALGYHDANRTPTSWANLVQGIVDALQPHASRDAHREAQRNYEDGCFDAQSY